ncbi:acyl-CoA N-acyltransferase, partial [Eremomyces bilateralis CBS 781.70]
LHPYVQALTLSDIESCVKLEEAAFPPTERCSREKFEYRLTKAGNICLGLFSSSTLTTIDDPPITFETSRPADSFHPARTSVLIGHVIATKTCNDTIHDEDMAIDLDWQRRSTSNVPSSHHPELGRTVAIHSLSILPQYQRGRLGEMLLGAYCQRIESSGLADRIALLTYDRLVDFYVRQGFHNCGPSKATFGGQAWNDLV